MIQNKDLPAYPVEVVYEGRVPLRGAQTGNDRGVEVGLTKREYIAAKVLPACVDLFSPDRPDAVAELAVRYADALLAELEK